MLSMTNGHNDIFLGAQTLDNKRLSRRQWNFELNVA